MIRLYLLGDKGLSVLQNIAKEYYYLIDDIIIGRDKNIVEDHADEIILLCKQNGFKYFEANSAPVSDSDYSIAISWKKIIDDNNTLIIIHDSLLPRCRGFNPLVTALLNGDDYIGATSIIAGKDYDTGPIINQKKVLIQYPIKLQNAIELLKPIYCELFLELIENIHKNGDLASTVQNDDEATYSLWRNEDDYIIDWNQDSSYIKRFIDSVGPPYKGAQTFLNGQSIRILDSEVVKDVIIENRMPGKVIFKNNDSFCIVCGMGILKVSKFFSDDFNELDFTNKFRIKFTN